MSKINLLTIKDNTKLRKTDKVRTLFVKGIQRECPVYQVSLELLYYNADNYHVASDVADYEVRHDGISLRDLSRDVSQRTSYNCIMDKILGAKLLEREEEFDDYLTSPNWIKRKAAGEDWEDIEELDDMDQVKEAANESKYGLEHLESLYTGIVLADGRILDGNFAFYKLREFSKSQEVYFNTVILELDDVEDEEEIKSLELALIHNEYNNMTCENCKLRACEDCWMRLTYDFLDKSVGYYRDVRELKLLDRDEYLSCIYRRPERMTSEADKWEAIWQITNEFLEFIGLPGRYKAIHKAGFDYIVDHSIYFHNNMNDLPETEKAICRKLMIANVFLNTKEADYDSYNIIFRKFWNIIQSGFYKHKEDELIDIYTQLKEILAAENINSEEELELIYPKCMELKESFNFCVDDVLVNSYKYELEKRKELYKRLVVEDGDITELELSVRSLNYLKKNGIKTVFQLMEPNEKEASVLRGMSEKMLMEIGDILEHLEKVKDSL